MTAKNQFKPLTHDEEVNILRNILGHFEGVGELLSTHKKHITITTVGTEVVTTMGEYMVFFDYNSGAIVDDDSPLETTDDKYIHIKEYMRLKPEYINTSRPKDDSYPKSDLFKRVVYELPGGDHGLVAMYTISNMKS